MTHIHRARKIESGFSLIEVLIAVVILATGLLALAALQGSLTRNSAEAKTRGRVAAMLTARMDELRSGGYPALVVTANPTPSTICAAGLPIWLCTAQTQANVGALTVKEGIEIWSSTSGGATFTNAAPADPLNDPQFKRVRLVASWTDASNDTRSLGMTSEFSALALTSAALPVNDPNGSSSAAPVVREDDPAEAGMIPIAIGNGSQSAATNPKPIILGRNNTLVETKYNVLTYAPDAGAVRVQQRVETTVIGCRCQYGNQSQLSGIFVQNFRPTYWDGGKYKTPDMLASARPAIAGPVVLGRNDNPQSELCTDCCRDHHDASGDTVKFDSFRSGNHDHYLNSNLSTIVTPGSNGEYSESCRVIRVDGFERVATDARIAHFDYIGTGPAVTDQAPDPVYTDPYKAFVVDYLKNRFITPSDGLTAVQRYALAPLKKPAQVSILANGSDKRYLHSHAVMVDYIETGAQTKIDSVLAGCTKANKVDCILPYIPFTTINMTELAEYAPSNPLVIDVLTGGANFNDATIVQGLVTGKTTATDGQIANANGILKYSNTALAGILPIDPDDQSVLPTAQQAFRVSNVVPLPAASFTVILAPILSTMNDGNSLNDPGVLATVSGNPKACATNSATTTNPYTCSPTSPLGVAASLTLSGYNGDIPNSSSNGTSINCTGSSGAKPYTLKNPDKVNVCKNYAVQSVTSGGVIGAPTSDGLRAEQTTITFTSPVINQNDVITVTFASTPVSTISYTCTYSGLGTNANQFTVVGKTCP